MTTSQPTSAVRLLGTAETFRESFMIAVTMLAVASLYQYASIFFTGYPFHWGEFIGTWMGLTCVWLYRTENIHSWPTGIISVIALGFFFRDIELPGQQWLNWGFFMIISIWGWLNWVSGGKDRSELKVTLLSWSERFAVLGSIAAGTGLVYILIDKFSPGSQHPILDSVVVASSVLAQFLLGAKKIESWLLWLGPVNIISIGLFFQSEAYTLTALYFAFLIHAGFAIKSWNQARLEDAV